MAFVGRIGSRGRRPGKGKGKRKGEGRGRMGGNRAGTGGNCVCPECGATVAHQTGVPCIQVACPECGKKMTRE